MHTVIIVIHLFVVLALIGVVLLQKSEGGALGMGGGGGGFLSSRGSANVLTRTTAILAGAFFLTSLVLSILAGWGSQQGSIFRPSNAPAPAAPGPATSGGGGSLLDQMKQQPQPPSGPQVPQSK
jgi:preprotein translocase subunit SecG